MTSLRWRSQYTPPEPPPPEESEWAENEPAFLPILPGAAGRGADTYGPSGRDAPVGGTHGAAQKAYWCYNKDQREAALAASGRRWVIDVESGLYDHGANSELEITSGQVGWVDLAPSPGTFSVYGYLYPRGVQDLFICNQAGGNYLTSADLAENLGFSFGDPFSGGSRWFLGYNAFRWAPDQILSLTQSTNVGSWGNILYEALKRSLHPQSQPPETGHSCASIVEAGATQLSSIRDLMIHCGGRNWLNFSASLAMYDGAVVNWEDQAFRQESGNANIECMLYLRGPDTNSSAMIDRAAGNVYANGNRAIGYSDPGAGNVGSRISGAHAPGYVVNPFGASLAEKQARWALLAATSGPRPASRHQDVARVLNHGTRIAQGETTNLGTIISDTDLDGLPNGVTVPNADTTRTQASFTFDPPPGVSSMDPGGVDIGAEGRLINADGYIEFERWVHRRLRDDQGVSAL